MPNSYKSPERTFTGDLGRRFPQPKRIRFSEYLQQQNSNSSRGQNGSLSPQQSFVSGKKAVRGDNLNTGTKVHAPQNQNQRGSKRPREIDIEHPPQPGINTLEPSLSRMNVSTPPETGFQPMPTKNLNWQGHEKVPRIIDLVNPIITRQPAKKHSDSLPFLEITLNQDHPYTDNSGAFSFALLDYGSTKNIINQTFYDRNFPKSNLKPTDITLKYAAQGTEKK